MNRLILNLPYTSQAVPPAVRKRLNLSEEDWRLEHWRLIDPYLIDLTRSALGPQAAEEDMAVYPFSPLVADPWGFWAAELAGEPGGAARPAIPAKTTLGRSIDWSPADGDLVMAKTVKPFQERLSRMLRSRLDREPLVLLVTVRSFNDRPWNFESNQSFPRPQVAVGAGAGVTPAGLAALAGQVFKACGWWTELNWPQAGAGVPDDLRGHPRLKALGLSLRRDIFMDPRSGRKNDLGPAVRVLRTVLNLLDQEMGRVAEARLDRARPRKKPSNIIKAGEMGSSA